MAAELAAALFDLDGVITATAKVHAQAWKALFNDFLQSCVGGTRSKQQGQVFQPFTIEHDYPDFVDGKPRYDGVHDFLASRHILLPRGTASDGPEQETECGLGNRKNRFFLNILERDGVTVFPGSVALINDLQAMNIKTALVTSSKNGGEIIRRANLSSLFQTVVDGNTLEQQGLLGKPHPDMFLFAAELLGVQAEQAIVFEDALVGVEAGHAGDFGLVVGVDRIRHRAELLAHGADIVVNDLAELNTAQLETFFLAGRQPA